MFYVTNKDGSFSLKSSPIQSFPVSSFSVQSFPSDPDSQFDHGMMYAYGEGVPIDRVEAVKWFRKAAEQGYVAAQFHLGFMYHRGLGVDRDYAEAMKWYRKAAEQGHAEAQEQLDNTSA